MVLTMTQKKVAEWLYSKIIDTSSSKAIEFLIGYCIEQDAKLDDIYLDVKKIKSERIKSGFNYLEDAMYAKNREIQNNLINNAREAFTSASELEDGLLSARAAFQVGICYGMLNEPTNALRWYERAFKIYDMQWVNSCQCLRKALYTRSDNGRMKNKFLAITFIGLPWAIHNMNQAFDDIDKIPSILKETDEFIPKLKQHLKELNSRLPQLASCEANHQHTPKTTSDYVSFVKSISDIEHL